MPESEPDEKLIAAKLAAIRASSGIDDYPRWGRGIAAAVCAAAFFALILLIMIFSGAKGDVVEVTAYIGIAAAAVCWTFGTFRMSGRR